MVLPISLLNSYGSIYSSFYSSFMILEAPPWEFLLYSRAMVEDLINKLDDPDLDCILIMEKAKAPGKAKPKQTKPKAPKTPEEIEEEKKKQEEEKNSKNFACYLNFGDGGVDYKFIQGLVKFKCICVICRDSL